MKLSEIKGKKALETLADLMEPIAKILENGEIKKSVENNETAIKIAQRLLKGWPDEIITILALLDGEKPETYEVNLLALPVKVLELINDPEIQTLFFSQDQTEE
jgi:hypothetical protein